MIHPRYGPGVSTKVLHGDHKSTLVYGRTKGVDVCGPASCGAGFEY